MICNNIGLIFHLTCISIKPLYAISLPLNCAVLYILKIGPRQEHNTMSPPPAAVAPQSLYTYI